MINSDFKDADGFRLQFEESVPDDERKFYIKTFPRVDDVAKDRVHCTTCDVHVGTAPISEKIIRTHQILSVTQCNKCFAFYNSGEFGKGEDGSEYYCRWCGQGGEVFCCSTCPFVFCNKCIKDNLSEKYVKEIEENDDWSCFVCNKEILKRMRAQHWALRNFMNKQLEKIQKVNINSEEELNNLLNDDLTTCCPKKKRKLPLPKPAPAPIKRPIQNSPQMSMSQPPAKRPTLIQPTINKAIKIPVHASYHSPKTGPRPMAPQKRNQSEVVCTPDISNLFNEQAGSSSAPPPLAMRQVQRPGFPGPRGVNPQANPIFHTVNGYQIDLNQASRQEIFRLPNGKLIQVRKQTNTTPNPPRLAVPAVPTRPQFSIRPTSNLPNMTTQARMARPQSVPRVRAPVSQPRYTYNQATGQTNSTPAPSAAASTIFTQQNGSISVARAPQPDTPLGKAKTAFEDRIIQGLEICQHTINKMITLTNSTSFKTSRSFADLKELYIHLQYLFTYTSGKFKTLQEGLVTGMEELAKNDPSLKEKNTEDDDELEFVKEKVDVIEVLSDDEEAPVSKTPKKEEPAEVPNETAEKSEPESMEVEPDFPASFLETILETPTPTVTETTPQNPEEMLASLDIESDVKDDEKIKKTIKVKVERLEDSKNSVIKQYLIAIQQRREAQAEEGEESDGGSIDMLLAPEVVLEESKSDEADKTEKVAEESSSSTPSEETEKTDKPEETPEKPEVTENSENLKVDDKPAESAEKVDDKPAESEKPNEPEDVVEIPSDDEEEQQPTENQASVESNLDDEITKIDSALPTDLMEVDKSVDESVQEVTLNGADDSAQNVSDDILEMTPTDTNEVPKSSKESEPEAQKEIPQENGTNHSENDVNEANIDATQPEPEPVKKIVESESTTIDDEKDLLDVLINSLDEPLAPVDVEMPEPLA